MRDQLKVFLGELQFHSLTVGLEWWWYRLTLLLTILLLCKLCIGLRIRYLTWIRTINRMVREMVSFELVKEVEKDVFCLVMSVGKRKKPEYPWGIEPQTFRFCAPFSTTEPQRLYGEGGLLQSSYDMLQHTARISNVNSVKFVNRIIHLPAPSWLVSSIGRALHRYRRGHGFKSRTGLNFFQVLFTTTGFSSVLSCEDLLISSFHRNANMWNFHISKIFRDDKFWVQ